MQVELLKKVGTYVDKKDGKEKQSTRFYLRCGGSLVPVEVPYFEGEDGRDYQYSGRKAVLTAFADDLPEKSNVKTDDPHAPVIERAGNSKSTAVDDGDIPF